MRSLIVDTVLDEANPELESQNAPILDFARTATYHANLQQIRVKLIHSSKIIPHRATRTLALLRLQKNENRKTIRETPCDTQCSEILTSTPIKEQLENLGEKKNNINQQS